MKLLVHERNIDILCISETWLLPHTPDVYVDIPHYKLYRCDNGRGAGVCIYVSYSLNSVQINTNVTRQSGIEDVWVTVQCRKLPSVIIGCIYRHPKAPSTSFEYIVDILRTISMHKKTLFVLGDLNDDLLSRDSKLARIIANNKFSQIIDKPTRVTPTSATLLDVIITNQPDIIINSEIVPQVVADHDLISVSADISKPKRTLITKTFRDLGEYNSDNLRSLLLNEEHTLNQIFQTDNVDKQVDLLTSVFTRSLDKCAPIVTKEIRRPSAPWMNDNIREAIKARNNAQIILKGNRYNITLQDQYKKLKKSVRLLINNAKTQHFHTKLLSCRGNTAATWKVIRDIVPNKKVKSTVCNFDNIETKAEEFNNFFANIGKTTNERAQNSLRNDNQALLDHHNALVSDTPHFRPQPVDTNTVILTIKHLQETKSFGSDNISLRFIKDSLFVIAFYLTFIINTSLVTGTFPTSWKHAIVVPLYKNGDVDDVSNYRPISLLTIFSKLLEKIVANQLSAYLENNGLLSNSQHGFRPKLSTETALTVMTDKIYNNMDKKRISLLTLCDLSKAFDSVSHNILLQKCAKINVDTFWLENYLINRTQSIRLNNVMSSKLEVTYGVPQGSILGPILFNIYVNDLPEYFNDCLLVQYADDTQFLHTGTLQELANLINKSEITLNKAREYFLRNGLMLNPNKTQCIFIGTRQIISRIPANTTIRFDGNNVQPVSHVKNLGVHMDSCMRFDTHINELNKKVMGTLMYINRISNNFDKPTRLLIVQSLVLSLLNYCIIIWGTTNNTLLNKVKKLQNFAAKVAAGGARKYDHVTPILKELQWLNIGKKITFDKAVAIFKQVNNFYPERLLSLPTVNNVTRSTTRQQNNLYVPRVNTDTRARSLSVLGPKLWNQIPLSIKETNTLPIFKQKLKHFLLENYI